MKEKALKLANDLAFQIDELSMWTRNESAEMIRKLVEEIDCWKLTAQHHEFMARHLGMIAKERQELLDKQMKPVAWMLNGKLHDCDPSDWAKEQYPDQDVIPLYTAPRELSDEEIEECYIKASRQYYEVNDCAIVSVPEWFKKLFAKAILKKASEK